MISFAAKYCEEDFFKMSHSLNNVYELAKKNKQHVGKGPLWAFEIVHNCSKEYTAIVDLIKTLKRSVLLGFIMIKGPCRQTHC